jgi:hypothetical protein
MEQKPLDASYRSTSFNPERFPKPMSGMALLQSSTRTVDPVTWAGVFSLTTACYIEGGFRESIVGERCGGIFPQRGRVYSPVTALYAPTWASVT